MSEAGFLDVMEAQSGRAGDIASATVLIMHGLGADGNDFLPIAEQLNLGSVGAVRFLFPNAPVMPVTLNGGYPMPAWYDILGNDLVRREDERGIRQSQASIAALIAREKTRGVPSHRVVIAGFSQGCAMALMTGLRYPERLAGIGALSGYLPLADSTAKERSEANRDVPIFMAHGTQDGVIPLARAEASRDVLQALGYPVQWHSYPMAHSVSPQEIVDFQDWLVKVLTT